jgi:hypothetical protein
MKTRKVFVDAFHAALRAEQELWKQVEGKGPGQPGFNKALWDRWMESVAQTTAASKALREAFAEQKTTQVTAGS